MKQKLVDQLVKKLIDLTKKKKPMVAKEKLDEFINIKWDPKGATTGQHQKHVIKNPGETVKQVTKDKVEN